MGFPVWTLHSDFCYPGQSLGRCYQCFFRFGGFRWLGLGKEAFMSTEVFDNRVVFKQKSSRQRACWLVLLMILGGSTVFGQDQYGLDSDRSAGQVASVFEQEPQWLEWIAVKSTKNRPKSSSNSWGSWWTPSKKSGSPISSYRRDNKTMSQRMWISTKRMWNTTASWLDPYPDPKPESAMRPGKKSWMSSWEGWGGKSDKPTQSVSEFIGQEHPK